MRSCQCATAFRMSVAAASVGFRWLDLLEKEFDKSFMDLEQSLRTGGDEAGLSEQSQDVIRKHLSSLTQCFGQLVHKSQTVFQTSAKLNAELVHLREELAGMSANLAKIDSEKKYLICCLQSTLLENQKLKGSLASSSSNAASDISLDNDELCHRIQLRLAKEMASIQRIDWDKRRLEEKCSLLEEECRQLRKHQTLLESELVGSRLDAKYLDKELAGRIQQIQILLASNTSQDEKQKVWAHIESSMHLQRSKAFASMCYSKQKLKDSQRKASEAAVADKPASTPGQRRFKQVHLHKHDTEDLGMAILGGREFGLPIMVSEIFPDSAVSRCDKMCAGDIIVAVNGDSFTDINHQEAVRYLSSLRGSIRFDLEATLDHHMESVCDPELVALYDFYDTEARVGAGPSTVQRIPLTHPGKAKPTHEQKKSGHSAGQGKEDLPQVHSSSPKRCSN